jgi:hypothetical protein
MIRPTNKSKTRLFRYLARLKEGKVLRCRRGTAIAEPQPAAARMERPLGIRKGTAVVLPSFSEPLPEDELAAFEGKAV